MLMIVLPASFCGGTIQCEESKNRRPAHSITTSTILDSSFNFIILASPKHSKANVRNEYTNGHTCTGFHRNAANEIVPANHRAPPPSTQLDLGHHGPS
jgi:hypothetical protein